MDQKRLIAAIALSIGILLLFELWNRPAREAEQRRLEQQRTTQQAQAPAAAVPLPASPGGTTAAPADAPAAEAAARAPEQRLPIENPARLQGSINLRGARLDDLVLKGYHETVDRSSPLVRLFAPRLAEQPYFAQWGWTAADGRTRVPEADTDWTADGARLAPGQPVTLRWDNGAGRSPHRSSSTRLHADGAAGCGTARREARAGLPWRASGASARRRSPASSSA
jgi:YidC/Oxa1 family membrane protein insertase